MRSAVLVDSSFFLRHQRLGHDAFGELGQWSYRYELFTCGMVTMEIVRGARTAAARKLYHPTFAVMACIPTSNQVWVLATDIARTLDCQGTPIPPQDILIAAHALQIDASVLTFDQHFSLVPGLTVLESLD